MSTNTSAMKEGQVEETPPNESKPPLYKPDRKKSISRRPSVSLQELDPNAKSNRRHSLSSKGSRRRDSKSSVTRDSSASTLVDEDAIVKLSEDELLSLPMEPQSPQITFYQGFRAVYPQLALPMNRPLNSSTHGHHHGRLNRSSNRVFQTESGLVKMRYETLQVRETMEVQIGRSTNSTSSDNLHGQDAATLEEIPDNARVHSFSIHNVSRLFTELLNERDLVLYEATKLDTERVSCLL